MAATCTHCHCRLLPGGVQDAEVDGTATTTLGEDLQQIKDLMDQKQWFKMQALLQQDVGTAFVGHKCTKCGSLPLQHAIQLKFPDEIIITILHANKEAASAGAGALLPLHLALTARCSPTVILALLEANPEACQSTDAQGNLPLHIALGMMNRQYVTFAMPNNPQVLEESDKVILSILEAFPDATKKTGDTQDFLPLNMALQYRHSTAVVLRVLNANIEACSFPNANGSLALHQALVAENSHPVLKKKGVGAQHAPNCPFSDEVILSILSYHKEAAKKKELLHYGESMMPLQKALSLRCSAPVILGVLEANKEACQVMLPGSTSNGRCTGLPLHQALEAAVYSSHVLEAIINGYECAVMMPEKNTDRLPLHYAAAGSSCATVVEKLIRIYPLALDKRALRLGCNPYDPEANEGKQIWLLPRDFVTPDLPSESVKMICKPSSYWISLDAQNRNSAVATGTKLDENPEDNHGGWIAIDNEMATQTKLLAKLVEHAQDHAEWMALQSPDFCAFKKRKHS